MFRPAHAAVGTLTTSLGASGNVMVPDAQLFAAVSAAIINVGDTTYLQVGEAPWVEIVRVDGFNAGVFLITRAIDGTLLSAFPAGTPVRYVMAAEAVSVMIQDVVDLLALPANLVFAINAPNSVSVAGSNVNINIVPTSVTSPDGTIDVTGSGSAIGVSVVRGAFGCCD